MIPDRTTPRPNFAPVFAEVVAPDVLYWISTRQNDLDADTYRTFIDSLPSGQVTIADLLTSLATETNRDAFAYCEALKNKLDWPVNTELVEIFKRNISMTERKHLRERTMDWVMRTGHRIRLNVGETGEFMDPIRRYKRQGKVIAVDKVTASATIEFILDTKGTQTVYAESLSA